MLAFLKGNVKSYQIVKTASKNIDPRRNGSQIIANFEKKHKNFKRIFLEILRIWVIVGGGCSERKFIEESCGIPGFTF